MGCANSVSICSNVVAADCEREASDSFDVARTVGTLYDVPGRTPVTRFERTDELGRIFGSDSFELSKKPYLVNRRPKWRELIGRLIS